YVHMPRYTRSTLFPYTTLFRSRSARLKKKMSGNAMASGAVVSKGLNGSAELKTMTFPKGKLEIISKESPVVAQKASKVTKKLSPDRKSTRLNSSHVSISYAVFC